jgi:hypothetical protein
MPALKSVLRFSQFDFLNSFFRFFPFKFQCCQPGFNIAGGYDILQNVHQVAQAPRLAFADLVVT